MYFPSLPHRAEEVGATLHLSCISLIIKFLFLGILKTSDSEHLEEKNPGKETSVRLIVSLLTTQVPPLV
jgi:hypothetical protein